MSKLITRYFAVIVSVGLLVAMFAGRPAASADLTQPGLTDHSSVELPDGRTLLNGTSPSRSSSDASDLQSSGQ